MQLHSGCGLESHSALDLFSFLLHNCDEHLPKDLGQISVIDQLEKNPVLYCNHKFDLCLAMHENPNRLCMLF